MKAFKHQLKSIAHSEKTDIVYDCSDPGCVSADTEFLTPTGWKRIDQYTEGDLVAQFHPDTRTVEFVPPRAYVKKPCDTMIHIAPARGTSQRLSPEHRVLYYRDDGSHGVCSADEFMTELHKVGANRFGRKFCTTFSVQGKQGIDLADSSIRVMVAVIADGHFNSPSNRCTVRLKKARKIARLRRLLDQAAIAYQERQCGGQPDFTVFTFYAPRREKEFGEFWWGATQAQLEVIADELPHWDSSVSSRPSAGIRFATNSKASADFAQYAFAAAKRPASAREVVRVRTDEDRFVEVSYCVHAKAEDALAGPGRKDSVYAAPNPEGFKYCFEVPTSFLLLRHNGYIFATGNTGKTFVRIKVYEARHKNQRKRKAALVFAPKSLLRSTWANDFKKFAPKVKVSVATAEKREAAFTEEADVYVTNVDAAKWVAKQPKKFFERFDELIVDESSAYKHPTSQRSKAIAKIAKHFKYRTCMTGTPNGRSIVDVWHQVFILDQGKRLGSSFYAFRNAVCESKQVGPNAHALKWTDKDGAEEAVFGLLQDIVIRHKFEDCVDIPANHRYTLPYFLSERHLKAYREMEKTQLLLLTPRTADNALKAITGQKQTKHLITAVNAAVVAAKLLQIASGAVYDENGNYHLIDDGRYSMVLDLVEERDHSLVLFHWQHQRDELIKQAEARGVSYCVMDGKTPERERDLLVARYQRGDFQVMFGHPKTVGHGLTLTRGTTTIWASPTYDAEIFAQGSKRQHRLGQTKKTETITIVAESTIDERVMEVLEGKNARMKNLLDLFELA